MDIDPSPRTSFQAPEAKSPNATPTSKPPGHPVPATIPGDPVATESADPAWRRSGHPFQQPVRTQSPRQIPLDIKAARSIVDNGLTDLVSLQRERQGLNRVYVEDQLRLQHANVTGDLRTLRGEVSFIIRESESHRWRKWFAGSVM